MGPGTKRPGPAGVRDPGVGDRSPTEPTGRFYQTDVKQRNQASSLITEATLRTVSHMITLAESPAEALGATESSDFKRARRYCPQTQDVPFDEIMDPIYS